MLVLIYIILLELVKTESSQTDKVGGNSPLLLWNRLLDEVQ